MARDVKEYRQVSHHTLYQLSTAVALVEGIYQGAVRVGTLRFDALRPSDNFVFALRVDGHFDYVHTRAMCRTAEGVPLVQAAAVQPEFEFHGVSGTLVRFWTPEYAKTLNVRGYHLHFLSADRQSGGHLLQCRGTNLRLQIQREGDYRIALPETEDFFKADLRRGPSADLAKAEGEKSGTAHGDGPCQRAQLRHAAKETCSGDTN
jgi:alpha-acetolactate decarboxylase